MPCQGTQPPASDGETEDPLMLLLKPVQHAEIQSSYCFETMINVGTGMGQSHLNILIVDDDDGDRQHIRHCLSQTEFRLRIIEAETAAEALNQGQRARFDCIFIDYSLPDANGIELIDRLRSIGIKIPIIVLTDQGNEQVAVNLMKVGAADYLSKSHLSANELSRSIRNAMKVYWAEQQIQLAQAQLRQTNGLLKRQNLELEEQRRQIEQQNLQLIEANRLKSEFLATITHELRTPLNSIMGFSQILYNQTKGSLNKYQIEMIRRILNNGKHLLTLVNDILDMSVIEANRLELTPSHLDLARLVEGTIAEMQPLADRKRLDLELELDMDDPIVYNDEQRLRQVLVNLVSNAIKFTDQGHVRVRIAAIAPNAIELSVEDTGIGIDPNHRISIFQPFQQADQTTKRRYPGTGLGLAIVHSLVSMMEGLISVDSEVGQGTTFRIQLPRQIYNPKRRAESAPAQRHRQRI